MPHDLRWTLIDMLLLCGCRMVPASATKPRRIQLVTSPEKAPLPRALRLGVTSVDALLDEMDDAALSGHEIVEVGVADLLASGDYASDRAADVVAHFERLGFSSLRRDGLPSRQELFSIMRWVFVRRRSVGPQMSEDEVLAEVGRSWVAGEILAVEKEGSAYRLIRPDPPAREAIYLEERGYVPEQGGASLELTRMTAQGTPRHLRVLSNDPGNDGAIADEVSFVLSRHGYDELHGCASHPAERWCAGFICGWSTQEDKVVEDVAKRDACLCALRLWTLGFPSGVDFGNSVTIYAVRSARLLFPEQLTLEQLRRETVWVSESPED